MTAREGEVVVATSPRPWELVKETEQCGTYICSAFGPSVCDLYFMSKKSGEPIQFVDAEANAELIVRAVNSHDDLVAALKDARNFVKAELDVRVDSHTLGGDMATLDETDNGIVGEALDCLARIDAALSRAGGV